MKRQAIILMVLMVVILSLCVGSKAAGQEDGRAYYQSDYCKQLEKDYVAQVKDTLKELGYDNPGVSLTKTMEADSVVYEINIHHRRIDKMDEMQRQELSDIIIASNEVMPNAFIQTKYIEY